MLLFRAKRRIEAGEQLAWDYTSGEKIADHNNANAAAFSGQETPACFGFGHCIGKCWKCFPRGIPAKLDKDIFENAAELPNKFKSSKITKSWLSPCKRKLSPTAHSTRVTYTAMPVSSDTSPVALVTRKPARRIIYSDSNSDSIADCNPLVWKPSAPSSAFSEVSSEVDTYTVSESPSKIK